MKFRDWLDCFLLGHDWTLWNSRTINFSTFNVNYVDHFIDRTRRCLRCHKVQHERHFVPAVNIGDYNADWSGAVERQHREGRPFSEPWDQRKAKKLAP